MLHGEGVGCPAAVGYPLEGRQKLGRRLRHDIGVGDQLSVDRDAARHVIYDVIDGRANGEGAVAVEDGAIPGHGSGAGRTYCRRKAI